MEKNRSVFLSSKRRIVSWIMCFLLLFQLGTLGMIYTSTYLRVSQENQERLRGFTEQYLDGEGPIALPDHDMEGRDETRGKRGAVLKNAVMYMVVFEATGEVLRVMNDLEPLMNDAELVALSRRLLSGAESGRYGNLIYRITTLSDGRRCVVMMDNTILNDSTRALLRNTMLFGILALLISFGIAQIVAQRIIAPMEEIDEKQKRFLSDAGHELKTPIAIMATNLEMQKREHGSTKWLDNILYENHRMKELVTQLLDLARLENKALSMEKVDLSRIFMGESLPFDAVAFEKGVLIETEIEENIVVLGDALKLQQLVRILLDNALDHIERKEGEAPVIFGKLKREKKYAVLTVGNPGREISEEEQKRIFERFYRADSSRAWNGHYGLGLSIAKAIVDAHEGDITLGWQDGCCIFSVKIPLQ